MNSEDPRIRHLIASIVAYDSWAKTEDRAARTAKARAALTLKFLDQDDPGGGRT